ncbi:MAG: hypothetical protein E6L06_05725 [Verrucomicrobia bacterium]|nr:MAG: hypothetical protein E6L06_05725 [Verrucomicrobiota bacterium]
MHSVCLDAIIRQVNVGIRYETIYRYDRAVRFSPHDVRLFPRTDRFLQITRLEFQTKPGTTVRFGRDVFDNVVASCFFDEPSEMLELRLALDVEATKKNPFDFVLSRRAVQMPFNYEEDIASIICAYCKRQTGESVSLPDWRPPSQESPRRETDQEVRRAEGSLHAWTEVFLPGAGWVGLDPTNGIFCNDNFIPAAVGLRPADITPISGSFYHRDRIPAEMKSRLELITL